MRCTCLLLTQSGHSDSSAYDRYRPLQCRTVTSWFQSEYVFSRSTTLAGNLQAASHVKARVWRNAHEKNNALVCGCCNLWRCHSDRSFCDADRAGRDRSCGENRASPLGLWALWPLLVAPELLPWLPCLRVLPAAPLLAPSLLVVIVGAEETTPPRSLFLTQ